MSKNRTPSPANASAAAGTEPAASNTATPPPPPPTTRSAASDRPRSVSIPGKFVSKLDDGDVIEIDAPEAEEVTVYNCPRLTKINAPKARLIYARRCIGLVSISAPTLAGTIDVRGSSKTGNGEGIEIDAPSARKIIRGEFK